MELSNTGQGPQTFIVKTISGLEEVLAGEITELGGENIQMLKRAVSFEGDKRMLYKANYCLRTAQRILMPIFSFQMADEDDLYININNYSWENHLDLLKTLSVDAVVSGSELTHSHYVALRTKDAIVDRFRTLNNGRRPSVDTENPHIRVNIHISGSTCNVSLDSSGASLHKRGYRVSNAEAPMSEVLAAGLIMLSGWKRDCHFIDPMCGSGTFIIEAAMIANNFPAGMYRKEFGFMHWPDFDEALWNEVTAEALDKQTEFDFQIIGSDISPKNLSSARANLKSARLHKDVTLMVSPISEIKPPAGKPGIIMINPPYGERIRPNDIIGLYKSIGNVLKQEFSGYQAWIISSDQKALGFIGLRPSAKLPVYNGPLECRFEHFDLYRGSKRGRYMDGASPDGESNDITPREPYNHDGKPNWRSKEAPEGDSTPREFKPSEYKSSRNKGYDDSEKRPPRRGSDSERSEYKSREFKPREYKPRSESGDGGFTRREKPEGDYESRKSNKPFRDDRPGRDDRPERRRVEKAKLKPATRIEERNEHLNRKNIISESDGDYPETNGDYTETENIVNLPEVPAEDASGRVPSKGNKFTAQRDYKITRKRELRPRKARPAESDPETKETSPEPVQKPVAEPKVKPATKAKTPAKPPKNYDDLED